MKNTEKRVSANFLTRTITRAAAVAALYTALTYISSLFGLSSGVIQLRLSEALCVLPAFMPEAVAGLFIGCLLANTLTGCVLWDVIFGSLATLIGALGAYALGKLPKKLFPLIPLPTVIANMLIVPFVLLYAYGAQGSYGFFVITVGAGEFLSAFVLGCVLYRYIRKTKII